MRSERKRYKRVKYCAERHGAGGSESPAARIAAPTKSRYPIDQFRASIKAQASQRLGGSGFDITARNRHRGTILQCDHIGMNWSRLVDKPLQRFVPL